MDEGDRWARRALDLGVARRLPGAEALGYEFLAENAALAGRSREALAHVAAERAIAQRIHSRERLAWTYLPAALSELSLGQPDRAYAEVEAGVALARAIGERRLAPFLQVYLSIALADLGRLDEALRVAHESLDAADTVDLLAIRTEARRSLAYVHYVRREWDAAIRQCEDVLQILDGREPALSKLLMGPVHVRALMAAGRIDEAAVQLDAFEALAARCQSPRAVEEATELRRDLKSTGIRPEVS
jgi:tetratricopeptide (TPR) repeat protein